MPVILKKRVGQVANVIPAIIERKSSKIACHPTVLSAFGKSMVICPPACGGFFIMWDRRPCRSICPPRVPFSHPGYALAPFMAL
jgi:hypothetical protein